MKRLFFVVVAVFLGVGMGFGAAGTWTSVELGDGYTATAFLYRNRPVQNYDNPEGLLYLFDEIAIFREGKRTIELLTRGDDGRWFSENIALVGADVEELAGRAFGERVEMNKRRVIFVARRLIQNILPAEE